MKSIFQSKTFWLNVFAIAAIVIQGATGGEFVIGPETQTALLGIVNIGLRLITKDAVTGQVMPWLELSVGAGILVIVLVAIRWAIREAKAASAQRSRADVMEATLESKAKFDEAWNRSRREPRADKLKRLLARANRRRAAGRVPLPSEATVLELTRMEMEGTFSNTREYVLDQVIPYCDAVEAMGR